MTLRDFPFVPTILVLAAATTMVALGFWQIGRADEKAQLIARYAEAEGNTQSVDFPAGGDGVDEWFRRSAVSCARVLAIQPVAGTAANGAKGWAVRAQCVLADGREALVDLGFSRGLDTPNWSGGEAEGVIAPGPRLIADPALAGLRPLAKPDPNDLPNNHIAYAGQWFFFAITALVIYALAVRSRIKRRPRVSGD